jgi:hypothetical protein
MELWKIGGAIFSTIHLLASGGGVHFLIVLYPSMQLKARASHFVTPNSFSF